VRKINLKAKNVATSTVAQRGSSGQISLVVGIIILLVAGVLYGATTYLKNSQAKKIAMVKADIKALKKSLDTNKNFKTVYDFQDRLMQISSIEKDKVRQVDVLNQLSQSTLGVNVVQNLKVATKGGASKIDIRLTAPDLATVAKQINAYKAISSQKQVSLKGSSIKDGNNDMAVDFTLPRFSTQNENQVGGQ